METTISEYERQAIDFLTATNTTCNVEFVEHGRHFHDDKEIRDIYQITLQRGDRKYSFRFGQSIANSKRYKDKLNKREYTQTGASFGGHNYRYLYPGGFPKTKYEERYGDFVVINGKAPTAYDVLSCVTKYDPGTLKNFCSEYGYSEDSRSALKTYMTVCEGWVNLQRLFSDQELDRLREIN